MKNNLDYLLSPKAIRDQSKLIFDWTASGNGNFKIDMSKLPPTVDYVLKTIYKNYPDLNIPFHSRWGHFRPGGVDRSAWLEAKLPEISKLEKARTKLDLVITSVLLDAGAGKDWKFYEDQTKQTFVRSEGLGVASFHMFMSGVMADDGNSLRADGKKLSIISAADVEKYFQVSASNPLLGVAGRTALLSNLGKTVLANSEIFPLQRPGSIIDYLTKKFGNEIPAEGLLRAVLDGLGPIWPGRISMDGVNLGDVWKHSKFDQLISIHKLSQWLTYSLVEPIEEAGYKVTGAENLTGLAEYRNGGLMVDMGVIELKDQSMYNQKWSPDSDLVIEWRCLTLYLLDLIGAEVQKALGKSPADFPLAKVLEGGTWWAGRFIANEKRPGGEPPISIQSDGTVF